VADVDPAFLPTDSAVSADAADLEVSGVLRLREAVGIGPWGRSVEVGGRFLIEVLVRAFVVVLVAESLEGPLLSSAVSRRRAGGLGLEGTVHAFVAAVLFWVRRLGELGPDAQADPPDGESGDSSDGAGRGEGVALSVRMASGRPYSWKRRWKAERVPRVLVEVRARQPSR
jgi:hypothetical protein